MQPTFETVVRIARAVDVPVGWLLGEAGFELTDRQIQTILMAGKILSETLTRTRERRHDRS